MKNIKLLFLFVLGVLLSVSAWAQAKEVAGVDYSEYEPGVLADFLKNQSVEVFMSQHFKDNYLGDLALMDQHLSSDDLRLNYCKKLNGIMYEYLKIVNVLRQKVPAFDPVGARFSAVLKGMMDEWVRKVESKFKEGVSDSEIFEYQRHIEMLHRSLNGAVQEIVNGKGEL